MVQEIAEGIHTEVLVHLKSMINKRKQKEGLVSLRNSMIDSIRRKMDEWLEEQKEWVQKIGEKKDEYP